MRVKDTKFKAILDKTQAFEKRLFKHPLHNTPNVKEIYRLCEKKSKV